MILHIMTNSVFCFDYIEQINLNFSDEHFFVVYKNQNDKSYFYNKFDNCFCIDSKKYDENKLDSLVKKSNLIIFHSLLLRFDLLYKFAFCNKKTAIVFWGADLYDWCENKNSFKSIKSKFIYRCRELLRNRLIRNTNGLCFLASPDYNFFEKNYNHIKKNQKIYYTIYSSEYIDGKFINFLNNLSSKSKSNKLNIMVGHSGSKMLNHVKVLSDLKKYKESFKIVLPLAYGNKDYINSIEKISQEFCDVEILKEMLPLKEYSKKINEIDILLINSNRQIAIGNISIAVLLRKYICLNEEGPNYDFFKNQLNMDIIGYNYFINLTVSQKLECLSCVDVSKNYSIMMKWLSKENFIESWQKIFELKGIE